MVREYILASQVHRTFQANHTSAPLNLGLRNRSRLSKLVSTLLGVGLPSHSLRFGDYSGIARSVKDGCKAGVTPLG